MSIVITGDILRPDTLGGSHQDMNIRSFGNLFSWQIAQAVGGVDMQTLRWINKPGQFNAAEFYRLNDLEISAQNWARIFNSNVSDISEPSIDYLRKFFPAGTVVIGLELPDLFLKFFDRNDVKYVDFTIHPVRFLDDIFFGIRTNHSSTFGVLEQHALPEERFFIQAGLHKTTMSRIPRLNIAENSCLFACQTKVDKSLIREGKVVSLADYVDRFDQIVEKYDKIYFKLHPCEPLDDKVVAELKQHHYAEFIDENVYRLICHENIKHVYSISSSVVYEASFFGKKATYFHKNPFEFYSRDNAEFDNMKYVPVYDAYLNPAFWSKMLEGLCDVRNCSDIQMPAKPNRLRISFRSYWGYNFLDFEQLCDSSNNAALKKTLYSIPILGRIMRFLHNILKK